MLADGLLAESDLMEVCFCSDKGCASCKGACGKAGTVVLVRVDMADRGEFYCEDCAADAMESGLFTTDESEDLIEPDDDPDRPSPEDYVIRSDGFRLHVGVVEGAFIGEFSGEGDEAEAEEAVREHRERTSPSFWPNVWRESDHGNVSLAEGWTWDRSVAHGR